MAENIEFIAAKDLPITEAEEVDVLVVDPATGELGLKAGANLGGSGGAIELEMELNDSGDYYRFTNIEQVQDVIDKNMNLYIICTRFVSGMLFVDKFCYSCMKDTLVIGDHSGTPYAWRYSDIMYDSPRFNSALEFAIDVSEYTNNAAIKVVDSKFSMDNGRNVVKAYASST